MKRLEFLRTSSEPLSALGNRKICIDISKHEYCDLKERHDVDGSRLFAYSPAMDVVEKLRALCQQTPEYCETVFSHPTQRARDFFDIFETTARLPQECALSNLMVILNPVFSAKRVPLECLDSIRHQREFHRAGKPSDLSNEGIYVSVNPPLRHHT